MIRLEWVFLMQYVMGIFMVLILQKLIQMKGQIDKITKEVNAYISFVTEDVEEEKHSEKTGQEEAQTRLIQEVLGEYFP